MAFTNCYQDSTRANAYASLEFANTYYLAYRDLPKIISDHVSSITALDFGCGTGRSTRFLQRLGLRVTGVDISEDMLRIARSADPTGDYRLVAGDDLGHFTAGSFDLVLCAFSFDNIPAAKKPSLFNRLAKLLRSTGILINLVSSPAIYLHEWASFSTRDFPENASAQSGDAVHIIVTDHQDRRPVEDILCSDASYRELYRKASLEIIQRLEPLAKGHEPYAWVNETTIAPWIIYVVKRSELKNMAS